jgi:hypothetical protein
MNRFIIFILLLFPSYCFGQFLPGVRHIETVSEVQDSMVLLNKQDVDKINKTYFEKKRLNKLNQHNEEIIVLLENKISIQDSIIVNKDKMLQNEIEINNHLKQCIEDNTTQYEKYLRKERNKKKC